MSGTLLLALFIISTLTPGDFPSADQAQSTPSVGKRYQEETPLCRMTNEDFTGFQGRVVRIRVDASQRILKRRRCFLERYPVLCEFATAFAGSHSKVGASIGSLVYQPSPRYARSVGRTPELSCKGRGPFLPARTLSAPTPCSTA